MEMTERDKATKLMEVLETCRKTGITIEELIEILGDLIEGPKEQVKENEDKQLDLDKVVSKLLREVGVAPHLLGYEYLRVAIIVSLKNREYLYSITKSLYPYIAKEKATTSSRVERAIRHAIETAWSRGNVQKLNEIFGYTISPQKGKPTNSEFIAAIVDDLELKNKCF